MATICITISYAIVFILGYHISNHNTTMAKKRSTAGKKVVTPTKLKTSMHHMGIRLPHGYQIVKRKRK